MNVENLVLEQLRAIRATQSEHSEQLTRISIEISAIGQQLGALTSTVYSGKSELDGFRRRIERIERRLEIAEA